MGLAKEQMDPLSHELKALLGDRFSTAEAVRLHHGADASYHPVEAPDGVAFVHSSEEVSEVVKVCARYDCPIIPFGTGTSLEGQVMARRGGVTIDVSQMNEILEIQSEDLTCRVQAGVTRKQLNRHLRDTGLFFPIDPGADASIGGMTATAASGTNAVRYGTMRENVMSVTVVLADGRIVKTGTRAKKSAAGYDLTRLFVGSEGTLGVITEIGLKLHGIPEAISAAVCSFDTMGGAVDTVITTIQMGVPVARIELLDEVQMDAINRYSDLDYPVQPTLFFEFHGTESSVVEQAERVAEVAGENGGGDFEWATQQEDRNKLWQARHDAYYAALAMRPGAKGWATDVCVPISELAEVILETKKDIEEAGLLAPLVGHVGDGNFHLVFVVDPEDEQEMQRSEDVNRRMVMRALNCGGTCTGEHGIGYGKISFLEAEHGAGVDVMRSIKAALDPKGLMNPEKIFAPQSE
ncbi:MAG: FAD-linked oxidase C-terminal domain-containing protein [Kiloniellales bacterium]|nr:FAD-linked oxidase C-terminal domain-containing protein [Kiloniellales bacterium]